MIKLIVTYKVKENRVKDNEKLVRAVYRELNQINDPGIHYATFKKADGVSFVHIASFKNAKKQAILTESESFQAFQAGLPTNCKVMPDVQPLTEVGSCNFV